MATTPDSPALTASQLATLVDVGEERTASVGDVLYRIGDDQYPFVAILEGEVTVLDAAGNEIIRHGPSRFLGEVNLLSGQAAFVTAVRRRRCATSQSIVKRCARSSSKTGRSAASCSRRSSPDARRCSRSPASGSRSSARTPPRRRGGSLEFARTNRLPFTWRNPEPPTTPTPHARRRDRRADLPLVRLPGGVEMRAPSPGELSRALGIGRELAPREEVDLLVVGAGPAGPRRGRVRGLGGPRHPRRREQRTRWAGGRIAADRELPGLPGRHHWVRADDACGRAGAQVRRPFGDALPGRGTRPRDRPAHSSASKTGRRSPPARCSSQPAPSTAASRSRACPTTKGSASSTPRGRPSNGSAAHRASGSSAAATPRARLRSGSHAAARWSPCSTAAPTCARRCRTT